MSFKAFTRKSSSLTNGEAVVLVEEEEEDG